LIEMELTDQHPDLLSRNGSIRILDGRSFGASTNHPYRYTIGGDPANHGTMVAGILMAQGQGSYGIAGVDWDVKVINEFIPNGTAQQAAEALDHAVLNNAMVVNMSFGGAWNITFRNHLISAHDAGVLLVAAGCEQTTMYPSGNPDTNHYGSFLTNVGSINRHLQQTSFAIPSFNVDLAAAGGDTSINEAIFTTIVSEYPIPWAYFGGTSAATPHVAGTASLIWSVREEFTNYDVEWILRKTAIPLGISQQLVGDGALDAGAALRVSAETDTFKLYHLPASLIKTYNNVTIHFGSSPFPPGHPMSWYQGDIYVCDIYKLAGSVQFGLEFDDEYTNWDFPWGWLSQTGYLAPSGVWIDPEDFNYEAMECNISNSSVDLETYFYYVEYIPDIYGNPWAYIQDWAPYNPNSLQVGMSVFGKLSDVGVAPSAPGYIYGEYHAAEPPYVSYIEITWERNPESEWVDIYRIQRNDDGGGWYNCAAVNDPGSGNTVSYQDIKLREVEYHEYRVCAHNEGGYGPYSNPTESIYLEEGGPGGPENEDVEIVQLPQQLTLIQNYPNPFNPTTTIRYGLPRSCRVNLRIINTRGQTVRTLVDEEKTAGWYTVTWDGKNESGQQVSSGIYLYLLETNEGSILKKMTLIR